MSEDDTLIDRIYEAALIPEMWPGIIGELGSIAGCYGGTLFSVDARQEVREIVTEKYREIMQIFLREGWALKNIRAQRLSRLEYAGFVTDLDILSREEMDCHPFYTDLLRPNGAGWAIGTIIPIPSGDLLVFNLERSFADGPIERSFCNRLDTFRSHLARAGLLSVRLQMQRAQATVEALQRVGLPAAILQSNKVLATNPALDLLGEQICLGAFGQISLAAPRANTLFQESLRYIKLNRGIRSLAIPATASAPSLIAHIVPIVRSAHDIFARASSIVVITPMRAPEAPPAEVLNGLFDLTAAESRITQKIVAGKTIETTAEELGIAPNTARKHLRSIFAKTGTSRQAELVGLLAGGLPLRRLHLNE